MDGIIHLPQYLLGTVMIILLPGPNSMYCLSVAAQHGSKSAYHVIAGILLGDSLLALATIFGAGALLKAYPPLFHTLKIFGGFYLLWLGVQLLFAAWKIMRERSGVPRPSQQLRAQGYFRRALLLSLSNPKAILFFLAFFMQFVAPDYPQPLYAFFILALILQLVSFTWLNILTFAGISLRHFFARQRLLSAVGTGGVGVLFCSFAVRLWTATL